MREKIRDALDGVGTCRGVRPGMRAAAAIGREGETIDSVRRQVWVIEIVIGLWIDNDIDLFSLRLRFRGEIGAGRRRRPVIIGADQDEEWHAGRPAAIFERDPTARVKRDGAGEIDAVRGVVRLDGPCHIVGGLAVP